MKAIRLIAYGLVAVVDCMLIWLAWAGDLGLAQAILVHLILATSVAGVLLSMMRPRVSAQHYLEIFLVLLGGPLGSVAATVFCLGLRTEVVRGTPELLEWYNTLSGRGSVYEPSQRAEHDLEFGAVLDPAAPTLKDIMASGSLAAKRSAIAYLTSAYHRDYHGVLRQALSDPEPTIRVQAAAVLTGLGQEARDDLDQLLTKVDGVTIEGVTPLAAAITKHITSHLLDADGVQHAVVAMAKLAYLVIRQGDDGHRADMLLQLVWGCHVVEGRETVILRAMLDKLVATPLPELAS